jgi:DMSO/TMAO reductase YedYZ molybdopterin-dependent catalytic subunit
MLESKLNKLFAARDTSPVWSMMNQSNHKHDPLQPHSHEPNPTPPTGDSSFTLTLPDGVIFTLANDDLRLLPQTAVTNIHIVSTGHGTTGPFVFIGTTLLNLIQAYWQGSYSEVELISADGFGNRVVAEEILHPDPAGPMLLAYGMDGQPMTRSQGLVRLIVPSERDDALRQVKWIGQVIMIA